MTNRDIYAEVTDRIVDQLEQGVVPWKKPWRSRGAPYNVLNGRAYRGINILLLTLCGHSDPRWGTFNALREAAAKQAASEGREIIAEKGVGKGGYAKTVYYEVVGGERKWFGGGVRKGEKGTQIVLWKVVPKTRKGESGDDEDASYRLMKSYSVFNASQADGIAPLVEEPREFTPIESAERILDGYLNHPGPAVLHGQMDAAYDPWRDLMLMPDPEDFFADEEFYAVTFHEAIHSTGHKSRLDRLEPALFGSDPYAREELVAEVGASFLSGIAGLSIAGGEQSAAYLSSWLQRFRNDRRLIVQAAAQAQKAADLVLGETLDAEPEPEQVAEAA